MSTNVTMPSMGFDMTEGKVSRWLKNVGDAVTRGETIGEIETDKATVDLSAPVDGVFSQILVQPGETVAVNTPIAVIAAQGEQTQVQSQTSSPAPAQPAAPAKTPPQAQTPPPAPAKTQPSAQPAASAPAQSADNEPIADQEEAPASSEVTPAPIVPTTQPPAVASTPANGDNGRIKASPVARNMAKTAGIDLDTLQGTGPGGRIIERDVTAAIEAKKAGAPAVAPAQPASAAPAAKPAPAPAAAPAPLASGDVALSKMRQTIARRLTESKTTIPHFYLTLEIVMGGAMKLRGQLNALASSDAEKLSVNDLVIAGVARTLRKFPNVNGYYKGDHIELHEHINVSVAVSVEDGLLTPVLIDADKKSLKQIAVESKEMAARARANKLKPEDFGTGTFSISNLGMFGIDEFSAIINPPESAILAVGVMKKTPVVIDDEIQIAQVMKVTLSCDHRIVDGALGAKFLQELKKLMENPFNLLLN